VLPATDTATARALAESVRAAVEGRRPADPDLPPVTASIGIATFPAHAADAESLFRAADAAMYAVKRATKNAVAVAAATQGAALPAR